MFFRLPAVLISTLLSVTAFAAPYIPQSDGIILERLPFRPNDPIARELAQLRTELRQNPRNLTVAVKLAQRYYGMVSEEGDPRYLGYAQAALAPWWDQTAPPVEVQVLRASMRQFRHDFDGAVSDLTQVLEREPGNTQALILRALIHIVQARYPQGMADCRTLRQVGDPVIGQGCEAMIDGLTGKARSAYSTLNSTLQNTLALTPNKQLWVQIRLAELAQRQGLPDVAERHFKQALTLGIADTFLLAAYADFLLEQRRPAEVVALLKDKSRSDVLLLRLAFAARQLNLSSAKERESALAARFAAARLRGESIHEGEEARFALEAEHEPKKALMLAQDNWKVQREPRDAQIFLEAALAMKDPVAAHPVLRWLDDSHIEDRHLIRLAQQLKGVRP